MSDLVDFNLSGASKSVLACPRHLRVAKMCWCCNLTYCLGRLNRHCAQHLRRRNSPLCGRFQAVSNLVGITYLFRISKCIEPVSENVLTVAAA